MKNIQADFSIHKLIPEIASDYVSGKDFLKAFYKYEPLLKSFSSIIKDKSKEKIDRVLVANVLAEQYSSLRKHEKVERNISLLQSEKTFTVTTGHQLNLFTGPLYFIYKILTTVQLAEKLSVSFPDYAFIPVYWMASEDHDFEEINHIHLFGEKMEWKNDSTNNSGGPSGKLRTEGIDSLINLINEKIGGEEGGKRIIKLLSDAYLKHDNLADATRYLVNELFGKYGLLVVDANEMRLKQQFMQVMKEDLTEHSSYKFVTETSELLTEKYHVQVHPREINLFYMTDSSRERITADGGKYLKELEVSPEKFSPNVVLRPLYQEMILPNVAVVGGSAEIAYWLQYKKMFEHFGVNFPMLMLRKSFQFIDEKSLHLMQHFNINVEDLFLPVDDLVNKFISHASGEKINLDGERHAVEKVFLSVIEKLSQADITLKSSAEAEKEKVTNAIDRLEVKLRRTEKNKHDTSIQKIKRLKEKLFPDGILQERYENFIPYYLKYGDEFFEIILNNGEVFDFKLNIISE